MKKFNFKINLRKIKLNSRGWILLFVGLFCIVTVLTVLIIGALRSMNKPVQQTTGLETDMTPTPTLMPDETDDPGEQTQEEITVTPTPIPSRAEENFIFPKEGVRPIAVMIDNETSKVLPQGGIGLAQIVYEALVEYGDTRYMAIFWNNLPDLIGPVRSSRHYFLDYAMEYDAIYAHIGGSELAFSDLELFQIDNIDGVSGEADGVYWDLTKDRSNYHDSYTSPERLNNFLSKAQYRTETEQAIPFTYNTEDKDLTDGQTAKDVFIKYSTVSTCGFYYDPSQKNYKRTRGGEFQLDRNTDEIIRTKNIIVLYVESKDIPLDKYGRKDLVTVGKGKGYYITNGMAEEITWEKSSRTEQTVYRDAKGEKIVLNPGQTWIQIVPLNVSVTIR